MKFMRLRKLLSCVALSFLILFISSFASAGLPSGLFTYLTMMQKYHCDKNIDGYKVRVESSYLAWVEMKLEDIDTPYSRDQFIEAVNVEAAKSKQQEISQEDLVDSCHEMEKEFQDAVIVRDIPKEPNSQRYSPEGTWSLFIESMQNGKKAMALACLSGRRKNRLFEKVLKMDDEAMKQFADSVQSFTMSHIISERIVVGVVKKKNGHGGEVTFRKKGDEWKISSL